MTQLQNAINGVVGSIDVREYGAKPDARRITDIATTSGSNAATSASQAAFTSADVGKAINIYDFVNAVYIFQGTISAVNSATSITLSGNASGTVPGTNKTAVSAVVVSGGTSGYAVNDTITLTGGTFTTATVLQVTSVSGGVVTGVRIITDGVYTVAPTNPVSQGSTSGAGVGTPTFTMTYGSATAWIGTDNASAINSALTAASNFLSASSIDANHPLGAGRLTVSFPSSVLGSAYLFSSTLNVPTNVVIDADAMLVNNAGTAGTANHTWGISMSSGACIKHLEMDCCQGMGITQGVNGVQNGSFIDYLKLWEVGYTYSGSSQVGLALQGNDIQVGTYWVKGANVGIWANQCNDVRIKEAFLIGCATSALIATVEEFAMLDCHIDTGSYEGITIDSSHNVVIRADQFAINGTTVTYGLVIGSNSTTVNHNLDIRYNVNRTGGTAVYLNYISDSLFDFNITNASIYSGLGTNISTAINYGLGLSGSLSLWANIDTTIATKLTGKIYGVPCINNLLGKGISRSIASANTWSFIY